VAQELVRRFPQAEILVADLANPFALETVLPTLALPTLLDCLLHIAGVIGFGRAADLTAEQIGEQVSVNLIAPMILTRALLPALRRSKGLVLIANSTATLTGGSDGLSSYVASKAGVRGFADVLRLEEAPHGVRVSTLFPGRTDTPMQKTVHEHEGKIYDAAQLLSPDTVARSILHVLDLPADTTIQDLTIRPVPQGASTDPTPRSEAAEGQPGSRTSLNRSVISVPRRRA
jgi:short-subunit dehydrogenase